MSAVEHKVDRTGWPAGPWDSEPDRVEFEAHGLTCLILRASSGNLCGYVAVPPSHTLHGKDYHEPDVDVHGGLTYSGACSGRICRVPQPGQPDNVHWFGFDCRHCDDLAPADLMFRETYRFQFIQDGVGGPIEYRTVEYVRAECVKLAQQLAEVAK